MSKVSASSPAMNSTTTRSARGGCSRDAEFVAPCLFVGDAERAGDHADGDEQCVDGAEQRGAEEADAPEQSRAPPSRIAMTPRKYMMTCAM